MSQSELLTTVAGVLQRAGIPFMLTGSLASSFQGEPRSTHDIDLVVRMTPPQADAVLRAFPAPRYYLSESAVREAIQRRGTFNLLDTLEGDKVDFWMLTDEPFDQSRFERRQEQQLLGLRIPVSAPEDTILYKLHWARLSGGSERQFVDALRVYELQRAALDMAYLEDWAARLDLGALWSRLKAEAVPLR